MKIGVVDTTFSRVNMGDIAVEKLLSLGRFEIVRRTVPGIKDLSSECARLFEEGCDVVLALGMVGGAKIDLQCAHEASLGIQMVKALYKKHIIEVFVHENEGWSASEFLSICKDRIEKHCENAVRICTDPDWFMKKAGTGLRQGRSHEGTLSLAEDDRLNLGFVCATFYPDRIQRMLKSAKSEAEQVGAEVKKVLRCPGVFDMPLLVKKLLMDKKIDAVVCLGVVVKGESEHDRVVAYNASREISSLSLEFRKPVSLGVIGPGISGEKADLRLSEYARRAVRSACEMVKECRS